MNPNKRQLASHQRTESQQKPKWLHNKWPDSRLMSILAGRTIGSPLIKKLMSTKTIRSILKNLYSNLCLSCLWDLHYWQWFLEIGATECTKINRKNALSQEGVQIDCNTHKFSKGSTALVNSIRLRKISRTSRSTNDKVVVRSYKLLRRITDSNKLF